MILYLNSFLWDVFSYILLIIIFILPYLLIDLEYGSSFLIFTPSYYNNKLRTYSESVDELMDSWSDTVGADETCDSSSTLVFGGCFITVTVASIAWFLPLCTNPASDVNLMLIVVEDCVLGTLFTLIPIIGYRTYTECINKDIPLFLIPLFVGIEILGQSSRVISLAIRMAANTTAGHSLLIILLSYMYIFIFYTIGFKLQITTLLLIAFCNIMLCLDFLVSSVQGYIIIILESYYELDSE